MKTCLAALGMRAIRFPRSNNKQVTVTYLDTDSTCRIYYDCPNLGEPSTNPQCQNPLPHGSRHLPESKYKPVPAYECPIWHFIHAARETPTEIPKPTYNVVLEYDRIGRLSHDYAAMLNLLLEFWRISLSLGSTTW